MSTQIQPASEPAARQVLISDAQVATMFGVSRMTIWRRVADGVIPRPIKIGGATRWVRSEIEAVIAEAVAKRDAEAA